MKWNETKFEKILEEFLWDHDNGIQDIKDIKTFKETEGSRTLHPKGGLVVEFEDGSEYQIVINKTN